MHAFIDAFERNEVVYRLTARQYAGMLGAISQHATCADAHRERLTSLYFDTATRAMTGFASGRPQRRESVRIRWADDACADERVEIEVGKRFEGVLYARRLACSRAAANAYLVGGLGYEEACRMHPLADEAQQRAALSPANVRTAREIDRIRARGELKPALCIVLERTTYELVDAGQRAEAGAGPEARAGAGRRAGTGRRAGFGCGKAAEPRSTRVAFDAGIAYRDLLAGARGDERGSLPLLPLGEALMQVDGRAASPAWLAEALGACHALPSTFSAYEAACDACAGRPVERIARLSPTWRAEAFAGSASAHAAADAAFARDTAVSACKTRANAGADGTAASACTTETAASARATQTDARADGTATGNVRKTCADRGWAATLRRSVGSEKRLQHQHAIGAPPYRRSIARKRSPTPMRAGRFT